MKDINILILFFLLFTILSGCSKPDEKTETSHLTTIPFSDSKPFEISDLVEEQKFILLSTDEKALFNRVDKLIAKNEHFYLFDHLSESGVLMFDMEGNFIRKIGEFGQGPQELKGITDFQVANNGDIQLLDKLNKAIIIYSPEGDWKRKITIPINSGGFAQFGKKWFLAVNFDHQSENLVNNQVLGVFDNKMDLDSLYFHYPTEAVSANVYYHAGVLSTTKNALIFHRPPNDTISILSEDGELKNRLIIDFGKNRLPNEVVYDFQTINIYKKQDASFQYLNTPALLVGGQFFGTIVSTKNDFWIYVYNIDSKELHTSKVNLSQLHLKDLILPTANMNDQAIVTLIDPVTFRQDSNPKSYPEHVRNHLKNEGSVLLLHYLKP